MIFASTEKSKEVLTKYTELSNKIRSLFKTIDVKEGEYGKDFMKIKINSGNDLPLGKILTLYKMAIVVRSVSQEDNRYYPQVFLDEFLYEL